MNSRSLRIMAVLAAALLCISVITGCRPSAAEEALATWTTPATPDTPAGREMAALLNVFNEGDNDALSAFIREHFTPVGPGGSSLESRISSQQRLYQSSHGLNLYEVVESKENTITVLAQMRLTQEWKRMTFLVEPDEPHRISGIMIVPADAPAAVGKPLTIKALGEQIDTYVERLASADQFSGVVLVARDGRTLFERAYGMADREAGVANTMGTRFGYASVGKMFTSVAVAQLVDAGRMAYSDPLSKYLPEYPADVAHRVTIHHLLTHTSGIVDYFEDYNRFKTVQDSRNPQRDYPVLFMNEPLRFEPGERFEYSNSNFVLLGAIIERVTGQRYGDYLKEHVFGPAGMTETVLTKVTTGAAVYAKNYSQMDDEGELKTGPRRIATRYVTAMGSAAGGGYTTAGDLLKFAQALQNHRLLSAATEQELVTGKVDYGRPGYEYGYGFILRKAGDERVAGHAGGAPGVDGQFDMYRGSGYTIIVLANYELVGEPITKHVESLLRFG